MSTLLPLTGTAAEQTTNTIYAAAFAALGMEVKTWRHHDVSSGADGARFTISDESLDNPALKTCVLHWGLIRGTLAQRDPTHPLLDAVRALRNRAALLRWIHRSEPAHLVTEGMRTRYVPGAEQVTLRGDIAVDDLHLVAAMGALGWPVVRFTGVAPHHIFYVPRTSLPLLGAEFDARTLVNELRSGRLEVTEPEHPIHHMLRALRAYDILVKLMRDEPVMLTVKDRWFHSGKSAMIHQDSKGGAYDHARRYFAGRE